MVYIMSYCGTVLMNLEGCGRKCWRSSRDAWKDLNNVWHPVRKTIFFSEFKTEAPNVRLKILGKIMCYNVQHQIYVTSLTDNVKLRHNKVTADRHLNTSSPRNRTQVLTSWPPCLLRHTSFLSRHENELSETVAFLGESEWCGRSGVGDGFRGDVKWILVNIKVNLTLKVSNYE